MEAHAHAICSSGGDVLNVGFGLGLIDEVGSSPASLHFQSNPLRNPCLQGYRFPLSHAS